MKKKDKQRDKKLAKLRLKRAEYEKKRREKFVAKKLEEKAKS